MVSTDPTRVTAAVPTPSYPPEIFHLGDQRPRTNGTIAPVDRHETLSSCGRRRMGEDHLPVSMHQPAVTSLEFVPAASGDDAPLGRNNLVEAGPKQKLKK